MAKAAPKKKTSPILWVGLAVLCVAAWVLTSPNPPEKSTSKPAGSHASGSKAPSLYTPEDLTAHFVSLNEPLKSAFKPLLSRKSAIDGLGGDLGSMSALGGPGWSYSGMVTINTQQSAIIENSDTGETVFLKNHDRWKDSSVTGIYPDHLDLRGPNGPVTVFTESNDDTKTPDASAPLGSSVIRGPIGGGNISVLPDIRTDSVRGNRNAN